MSWATAIRYVNILGCIMCLVLLAFAARANYRRKWQHETRVYWWALIAWTSLGLESAFEGLILHVEPGPRTIIQTLVVAWNLRALTLDQRVDLQPAFQKKNQQEDEKT